MTVLSALEYHRATVAFDSVKLTMDADFMTFLRSWEPDEPYIIVCQDCREPYRDCLCPDTCAVCEKGWDCCECDDGPSTITKRIYNRDYDWMRDR